MTPPHSDTNSLVSLKHNPYDTSTSFLLKIPAAVLGLYYDQKQGITLVYHAHNLVQDHVLMEKASRIPNDASGIARTGNPKWTSLRLTLKEHCPILCPDLTRIEQHQVGSGSPWDFLIELAKAKEITMLLDLNHVHRQKQAEFPSLLHIMPSYPNYPVWPPSSRQLQHAAGGKNRKRAASSSTPSPSVAPLPYKRAHPDLSAPTEVASLQSQQSAAQVEAAQDDPNCSPVSPPIKRTSASLPPLRRTGASSQPSPALVSQDLDFIKDAVRAWLPKALRPILNELLLDFLTTAFTLASPSLSPSPSRSQSPLRALSQNGTHVRSPERFHSQGHQQIISKARQHVKATIEAIFGRLANRAEDLHSAANEEFFEGIADHKVDVALIKDDTIEELQHECDNTLRQLADTIAETLEQANGEADVMYSDLLARLDKSITATTNTKRIPPPPSTPSQPVNTNANTKASITTREHPSAPFNIPGLRDDVVHAYCDWHCAQVRSEEQKEQYRLARDLTLADGLDLELVLEDADYESYTKKGVLVGVARRFVRDVEVFVREYRESVDKEGRGGNGGERK